MEWNGRREDSEKSFLMGNSTTKYTVQFPYLDT
jgi:hypothetical protein